MVKALKNYKLRVLIGVVVFIASILLIQILIEQRNHLFEDHEKRELTSAANLAKEKIETLLNQGLVATSTLSFIIQTQGINVDFNEISKRILAANSKIDAIQLVRGGVITHVYPLEGNEVVLGYNILADSLVNKEAFKAILQNDVFYAGPLQLRQGGTAVVGRLPIYIDGRYWGFSAVIIKLSTLISIAEMDNSDKRNYVFQLSKNNPVSKKEEYFLAQTTNDEGANTVKVTIPEGDWNIYVTSKTAPVYPYALAINLLGICFALILGFGSWYVAKQPIKLKELVDEKVAELRHTQKELIESEEKFRTLIEQSRVGAFIMGDNALIYVSPGFELITGYTKTQLFNGMKLDHIIHPDDIQKVRAKYSANILGLESGSNSVVKIVRADGTIRHIEIVISIIIYKNDPATIGTIFDITEQMEETARLNEAVIDAQEKERLQIGMELHDNVQQILAASSLNLEVLKTHFDNRQIANEIIGNLKEYTSAAIHELRRLSQQLAPSLDPSIPLSDKIHSIANNLGTYGKLLIAININLGDLVVSEKVQLGFIRIIQEQLTNIIKHAQTNNAFISMKTDDKNVTLIIADDGKGFDTSAKKNGIGLENIKRRAEFMDGRLQIVSSPGNGAKIIVEVPLSIT